MHYRQRLVILSLVRWPCSLVRRSASSRLNSASTRVKWAYLHRSRFCLRLFSVSPLTSRYKMTVRRSARLQGQDAPTPIVQEKPRLVGATSNVTSSKKRKAQTSSVNKDIGVNKRNTATPPSDEVSSLPTETPVDPQDDALSSLPVEILDLILDAIQQDVSTLT